MELEALLDLLRAKGVRRFEGSFIDRGGPTPYVIPVKLDFGADDTTLRLPFTPTTTSTADLERELAEEAARPKDALALALTAGDDHGDKE